MREIATSHPAKRTWNGVIDHIRSELARRQLHPSRVVVLLPYAQLVPVARDAWRRAMDSDGDSAQFLPRFETSMSWSQSLGAVAPGGDDIHLDGARDALTAASLLARAGLAAQSEALAGRLMQAAWSLARVAAAVPAPERPQWGARLGESLCSGSEAPALALELALARIALAWAASSSYATDTVFSAAPDLLVVVEGFQTEPLTRALQSRWGERVICLPLVAPIELELDDSGTGQMALHAATDAEDEAQRSAACVLRHLVVGHSPVALVAQDRVLTRRVHALLSQRGVAVQDETGWTLSTTRAAATLMSLLQMCRWDSATDNVLDWLKNAPTFAPRAVAQAETSWRRLGLRDWRTVSATTSDDLLVAQVQVLRNALQNARALSRWLADLRAALQAAGQWPLLMQDPAGQAVLAALRLAEGREAEFADVTARLDLSQFTAWVAQTLDDASFKPAPSDPLVEAQVVILPLGQLLGRAFEAVVLPGCDELRLPTAPVPPGSWSTAQRELLGLPSREQLAAIARANWHYALRFPQLDVLWRISDAGEQMLASGFVQEWQLNHPAAPAPDPRVPRALTALPCAMPQPRGDALTVERLSASAYEDLRQCPYRFFALRQLKLQDADELEQELGKRDFGNWLHTVLRIFHEALNPAEALDLSGRIALINIAAEQATTEQGLSKSEFLPFAASWPRVRAGYLQWLAEHEATGTTFQQAECWQEAPLGRLRLVGKIDRIDQLSDGSRLVIDYKTESRTTTAARVKTPLEDTQLAFYAALLSDDTLAAAYVNVGEKEATRSYEQSDVVALRDLLLEGIVSDLGRIAAGATMPALGAGKVCEYCAVRGVCRKDFWGEV